MNKYIDVEEIKNRLLQKGVEKSDIEFLLSVYKEHQEKNNIPALYVIDKVTGKVHRVGDDVHDLLFVDNGVVRYFNLQNSEGTGEDCSYEFIETDPYGHIPKEYEQKADDYRKSRIEFEEMNEELKKRGIIRMW